MRISKLIAGAGLLFLFACTHQMNVNPHYVASNPDQFTASKLKDRKVALLIAPDLQNYLLVKRVSSQIGGLIIKDKLVFFLGNAVSAEIENMTRAICDDVKVTSGFSETINKGMVRIVPGIVGSSLDLPVKRGGKTAAWVTVEYRFYDADGVLIMKKSVTGAWSDRILLTRENYTMAFQGAIKDLTVKSKGLFENTL